MFVAEKCIGHKKIKNMDNIKKAVEILRNGGVILYPTDTIWGLGCDPTNDKAIQRIFEIKKRPANKSLILLAESMTQVEQFVPNFPDVCYDLTDFAESPLTIVYPCSRNLSPLVCGDDKSIAIRVSKDVFCKKLIQQFRKPIVSTSANISGERFPLHFDDISNEITEKVDFILENPNYVGTTQPSKIIKIAQNGEVKILR